MGEGRNIPILSRLSPADRKRRPRRQRESLATCSDRADHTESPEGYLAWHEWAEEKRKTHFQRRCPGCRLYAIWEPNPTADELAAAEAIAATVDPDAAVAVANALIRERQAIAKALLGELAADRGPDNREPARRARNEALLLARSVVLARTNIA